MNPNTIKNENLHETKGNGEEYQGRHADISGQNSAGLIGKAIIP